MKQPIYLDYAATTPLDYEVVEMILNSLKTEFGNPSSIYTLGQKALHSVDAARETLANFLGCKITEVIFTGSATEANNLAIFGVIRKKIFQRKNQKPHIITSQVEHSSVLEPCRILEKEGLEVTYLPVNKEGLVNISDLEKAVKENTILISIMYANNEIGSIQPITEIGKLIKTINNQQSTINNQHIYFHSDAVQAVNYLNCNVDFLGVDFLTLSSHKIYGPKGIGALFVKKGTGVEPLIFGGGHEFGFRSGTENVPCIAGFGKAIEKIKESKPEGEKIRKLRDKLIERVLKTIPESKFNGSLEKRLPNNANFSFKGIEGESLVIALDQEGIAASTGSACSQKILEPSHVLLALGLSPKEALSSLRLTLGKYTTEKEIDKVLEVLPKIIARLRKIS